MSFKWLILVLFLLLLVVGCNSNDVLTGSASVVEEDDPLIEDLKKNDTTKNDFSGGLITGIT